jgi:hypothetical protein
VGVARLAPGRQIEPSARHAVGKYPGKYILAIAKLLPDRVGEVLVLGHGDLEQSLRMADRQGLEKQRIDQAEDGGVRADSQRQRKDRDGGECGAAAQSAYRIANILHDGVEHFAIMTLPGRWLAGATGGRPEPAKIRLRAGLPAPQGLIPLLCRAPHAFPRHKESITDQMRREIHAQHQCDERLQAKKPNQNQNTQTPDE